MKKRTLFIVIVLFLGTLQAQESISLTQVEAYMNTDTAISIEGEISKISRFDKIAYINLGGVYPNEKLNLVILKKELSQFKNLLSKKNEGKRIKIQGYVTDYKDNNRPQILLTDIKQVEVLE